ncbi:hypothetical protein, partial [Cobetia amphilecti]|uniref:hypothetical protein n=1 Tax=Cobetia amphilecti TaxID=1055104 RepID=UPI0025501B12
MLSHPIKEPPSTSNAIMTPTNISSSIAQPVIEESCSETTAFCLAPHAVSLSAPYLHIERKKPDSWESRAFFSAHKENRPCSKAAGAVRDKCLTMTYS